MAFPFNKALIIRFSSVGDIVLSSLLVRVFRSRFPACQIDYVVKEEFAGLIRHNPHVTNVIELPRGASFADLQRLRERIRQSSYDVILDIHDSLRSRYLSAGAKNVRRINKRKLARFLLVRLKVNLYNHFGGAPGVALRYVETAKPFGVEDDGKGLDLFYSKEDASHVDRTLTSEGFGVFDMFIGICPAAKHKNKMWLKERFAEAGSALARKHECGIAVFGAEGERELCSEVASLIGHFSPSVRLINLAGRLSLSETAAALDKCLVVVTNDSGLMHIAAARKRNVVALFGPTVKELGFFPFGTRSIVVEREGLACRPCTHIGLDRCPKRHFKCMNEIMAQPVIDAASTLLSSPAE